MFEYSLQIRLFVDLSSFCFIIQVLYESFDEPFDGRWIVSKNGDYEGMVAGTFRRMWIH